MERAGALAEAEALEVAVDEGAGLQRPRIGERTPDALVVAVVDGEAVAVVHRRTEVVVDAVVARSVQVHAGQRRDADVRQRTARIESRLDIDDGCLAGLHLEAVGARRRDTIEQRMNDD